MSAWEEWQDADACLDAAMAFLDEFNSDELREVKTKNQEQASSPSECKRTRRTNGNSERQHRYRKRRKDEITELRTQAELLDKRLRWLKERSTARSLKQEVTQVKQRAPCDALGTVWMEIATRQYQQRSEAEKENIRLRRILDKLFDLSKCLERVLVPKQKLRQQVRSIVCKWLDILLNLCRCRQHY